MAEKSPAYNPVKISARDIPPPSTISPEARKILSDGTVMPKMMWPPAHDHDAWRKQMAEAAKMREPMIAGMLALSKATMETTTIAGIVCYECVPTFAYDKNGPVCIFVHGGAFVTGDKDFAMATGARTATGLGLRTISVDYRMPPDHPFPAAPEDCVAVYKEVIKTVDPRRIVFVGSSAGGNVAAAAVLMIRDRKLPAPGAVILLTPEVDLTESGDSFRTNEDLDVVLKRGLPDCNALYANGHDLRDPYLSPLFADFTKGFPPTLVQTGTRDLFLSNSALIHRKLRKAGIDAELHVWEAMPHAGFIPGEAPENAEIQEEVVRFIKRVIK
jgi:acetyl esterase/lipase